MKKLFIAASLAAFVTVPAFAQQMLYGSPPDSSVVVADGRIIGQDPDPNVRLELRRNALNNEGIY